MSVCPPGIDGIKAELGGMRFRTSQPKVSAIVDELGLQTRPFRTAHDSNLHLLRGARLTAAGLRDPGAVPYTLPSAFRGRTPGELLLDALDVIFPGAAGLAPDDLPESKRSATYRGRPLHDWPLGDALRDVVGDEGYALITDSFGYVSVFGDRNAADGIPWLMIEARPEIENTTLVDGMERLPRELCARFAATGGTVRLQSRLHKIERAAGRFQLEFGDGARVTADRVVLAMPRSALERVEGVPVATADDGRGRVTTHAAGKLCLAYETAWWRDAGVAGLRTVTDSPLQKIYDFDRTPDGAVEGAAFVISYTDGEAERLWRSMAARTHGPTDTLAFDDAARWQSYATSPEMVSRAHQEMATLHRRPDAPQPYAAAFMDWAWPPASGAYSLWDVGAKSWEVIPRAVQPSRDEELYVCGESYSESQGWIEGALETAQLVADRLADAQRQPRSGAT